MTLLALALVACDVDGWLRARDVRAFREVEVSEAQRLLATGDAVLLEAVDSRRGARGLASARPVHPDRALPDGVVAGEAPVVVVAADTAAARRLAARLVRAGARNVAVVRGGVTAWREDEHRRTADSSAVF